MRTTFGDLKASRIPAVCNVSPTDDRLIAYTNEAQQRLIQTGEMIYGLHQRVQFCVTSGCLVLPRQIAAIEAVAVCDHPISVRNRWFEWLPGIGLKGDGNCSSNNCCGGQDLLDRGNTSTFADIIGVNKKVKAYADVAEDADAIITIFGMDENNAWIRTFVDGEWIDGEQVLISTTPTLSVKFFSAITGVQKPITNGTVRLYEYDTDLTTQRAIAIYEPDETNPTYRKMFVSALGHGNCHDDEDDEPETTQVTVMAKLEFIPVRNDTDWLLIGNLPALKDEIMSIMKRENNLPDESLTYHAMAVQGLRSELRHYLGRGAVNPMRMQSRYISGAGVRSII